MLTRHSRDPGDQRRTHRRIGTPDRQPDCHAAPRICARPCPPQEPQPDLNAGGPARRAWPPSRRTSVTGQEAPDVRQQGRPDLRLAAQRPHGDGLRRAKAGERTGPLPVCVQQPQDEGPPEDGSVCAFRLRCLKGEYLGGVSQEAE